MPTQAAPTDAIPFVNSKSELKLAYRHYPNAAALRVSLGSEDDMLAAARETQLPLWVDASVDGFHTILQSPETFDKYRSQREAYANQERHRGGRRRSDSDLKQPQAIPWIDRYIDWEVVRPLGDAAFVAKPDAAKVKKLVKAVLDACAERGATILSVPQLPLDDEMPRSKINTALIKATVAWAASNKKHSFVLPVIFTHRKQTDGKTQWRKRFDQFKKGFADCSAKYLWIVDSSLDDAKGSPSDKSRLTELLTLHKEIKTAVPQAHVIAGPYWGMNLVLWARGLAAHPPVPIGNTSKYIIPGGPFRTPSPRVTLKGLHRKVSATPDLLQWLRDAQQSVPQNDAAHKEFASIVTEFAAIEDTWSQQEELEFAKQRLAAVYASWVNEVQATPANGRAILLFQKLTAAYVLGCTLPELPKKEQPARLPGQVAEHLMMCCLS